MSESEDWDVEQYKAEHECDEHWELRKRFLLEHKGKFPEDQLLCLAQVLANVELLGCRYPEETMELIADLGRDILEDYRDRQKKRIKRTFVKASDAVANSRDQGQGAIGARYPVDSTRHKRSTNSPSRTESDETSPKKMRIQEEGPYGDIVIVKRPGDIPQNTLACAVAASGSNLEWKYDRDNNNCKCSVFINSKLLAEAIGTNQKVVKRETSILGIKELQKYYYTIEIKQNISGDANITATSMLSQTSNQDSIPNDNIGMKLMKLMGWSGGGLGKSEQGIVEPVTVKQQISREGLGLKMKSYSTNDLKTKAKDIMRKYLAGDMKNDLIFSSDFSNDERAVIHQIARQLGLKSHSYGPKNQRTLVVCRKIAIRDLVDEIKDLGGKTDKYELIEPIRN